MESIELTEEHRSKLLEMCRILFPEMFGLTIQDNGYLNYYEYKKHANYDDRFHWFEFCMTHLARILMCKNTKHMQQLFMGLKHPIDYLYEEFKKLK